MSVTFLVLTAVFLVAVLAWSGRWFDGAGGSGVPVDAQAETIVFALVFTAWNVAPLAAAVWIVLLARRWWPHGLVAFVAGSVMLAAFTFVALRDFWTSDSSAAALIFIFLPFYLWLGVGGAVGMAALLQKVPTGRGGPRDVEV